MNYSRKHINAAGLGGTGAADGWEPRWDDNPALLPRDEYCSNCNCVGCLKKREQDSQYWRAAHLLDLEIEVVKQAWNIIEPHIDYLTELNTRREVRQDVIERYSFVELSPRESEVLHLLGDGVRIKEIARRLRLSPKTVSTYRTRLLNKLNLTNNADLVRWITKA